MINTGPMGMNTQQTAAQPLAKRVAQQRPMRSMSPNPNMSPTMSPMARKSMMPGKSTSMGASGAGIGSSPFQNFGYKPVNATGATGNPTSQFGAGGGMPSSRIQADPLMSADAGPVAASAPPMFMPPPGGMTDMSGGNMGATAGVGNSMLMDQYMPNKNRDPRFRY